MIKGNFTLDSSHTLGKTEDALLVITQVQKVFPSGQLPSLDSHSLVICSQGGFFDDVKVWSGEDIKALQAAIDTLQNTKQDVTSEDLATIAKTIVGAINELFNGGVKNNSITTEKLKDQAVEYAKLSASIRSTLDMVEARVKVLSSGTDLKTVTKAGVYILSGTASYLNAPTKWEHYNAAILIVTGDDSSSYNRGKTIIGFQSGSRYPFAATLRNNEWTETDLDTALAGKLNNTSTLSDTEINNIWDNN